MPPLKPIAVQPKAFWRIHVDVFGPLDMSQNGNRYVALGVCALVKYVEAKGTSNISKLRCGKRDRSNITETGGGTCN